VTLEDVGEAIIALREGGKEPSVRNIRGRTGGTNGTNGTVMKFMAEWLKQELNEQAAPEIDETLLKNLKVGIGKSVRSANEELTQKLGAAHAQRAEALEQLDEVESEMGATTVQMLVEIEVLNERERTLQIALADTEKQLNNAKQERDEVKADILGRNKEILRLPKEEATARATLDLLERQNQDLFSGTLFETVVRKVMDEERASNT